MAEASRDPRPLAELEAREAEARAELERLRKAAAADEEAEARRAEHAMFVAEMEFRNSDIAQARAALRQATEAGRDIRAAQQRLDRLILEKQRAVAEARTKLLAATAASL